MLLKGDTGKPFATIENSFLEKDRMPAVNSNAVKQVD